MTLKVNKLRISSQWALRKSVTLLTAIVSLYILIGLAVFFNQRRLEYFPSHVDINGLGDGMYDGWRNSKGEFIGYLRPSEGDPKKLILFFHGNGGEALHREWLAEVASPDSIVFLAEYPGYGARPGVPSEASLLHAAEDIYDEISNRYKLPVTVVGHSLGTGVASYLASVRKVEKLALIAPFTSAADVGAKRYPMLPVRWMMSDTFDSEFFLKNVNIPLYIIHGARDMTIPIEMGKTLFEEYAGNHKTFTEIPEAGHNDITFSIVHSSLAQNFREFLK